MYQVAMITNLLNLTLKVQADLIRKSRNSRYYLSVRQYYSIALNQVSDESCMHCTVCGTPTTPSIIPEVYLPESIF